MLIDTRQIINLTDLRSRLGKVVEEAANGKTFLVAERGEIKVAVVPSSILSGATNRNVFDEIEELRKKIDEDYRKSGSTWKAVDVIRKMRDDRTAVLLRRAGIKVRK